MTKVDEARAKVRDLKAQYDDAGNRQARLRQESFEAEQAFDRVAHAYQVASREAYDLWLAEVVE